MAEQVLIAMDMDLFWNKLRILIVEVLEEREQNVESLGVQKPQLLKVYEVCKLFQISKPTLYDWMRKGQLRSIKIESRRFFLASDIQELVAKNHP